METFGFGTQIRKSPYFNATVRWGAAGFSVYNHMYIPRDFGNPEQNFWNLVNAAILCDVAVERQVEITGPDAARFTQMLTPRDLTTMAVGQCKYVLITNASGGILNDPIALRLGENHFWLSLADSDILLWAQGLAVHSGLDVQIREPDVSPLQLQGPQSRRIMQALFGDSILDLQLLLAEGGRARRHSARHLAHRLVERTWLRALPAGRIAGRRALGEDHGGGRSLRPAARAHLDDPPDRGRNAFVPRRHGPRDQPVRTGARAGW